MLQFKINNNLTRESPTSYVRYFSSFPLNIIVRIVTIIKKYIIKSFECFYVYKQLQFYFLLLIIIIYLYIPKLKLFVNLTKNYDSKYSNKT